MNCLSLMTNYPVLSLGQRMHVELSAVLVYESKLLLVDENEKVALYELLTERCKTGMSVL